jgi:hypothetical protein
MGRGLLIQSVAVYVAGIGIKKYSRQGIEGQSQSAMLLLVLQYRISGYKNFIKKQETRARGNGARRVAVFRFSAFLMPAVGFQ